MIITSQKFSFCIWQSFTIKLFLTIWPILFTQQALAQVTDDFSDGDFITGPAWHGDTSKFKVENYILRLRAPAETGAAYLSTPSKAINRATWEFTVMLDFNPSSSNFATIFLASDNPDLSGALNGYFVMLGSSGDDVCLYKQSGTTREKIIDGANGRVNFTTVNLAVKVTRDDVGNWQLYSDVGLTGSFLSEGTAMDNTYASSDFIGVSCTYTSTRSTRFYFDKFHITGDPFTDVVPPECLGLTVLSEDRIDLIFSEEITVASAEAISNYSVLNGVQNPSTAVLKEDQKTVSLKFDRPFQNAVLQSLSVSGVKDLSNNVMTPTMKDFIYFNPITSKWKDVIVTEVFPDPEPRIGLPATEYIEIHNRSNNPFELKDWVLTDGSSSAKFPATFIFPGQYIIVTSDAVGFNNPGDVIQLADLPTLNNSGDNVVLKNAVGVTIDSVKYSDAWYGDNDKQAGGWSLEIIDPGNICSESENWVASEDQSGGTPGHQNSVFASKPDLTGPQLISAIPLSPSVVQLTFNEKLDSNLPTPSSIVLTPDVSVSTVGFPDNSLTELEVALNDSISPGSLYWVRLNNVFDCSGNRIQDEFNSIDFGLPQEPDSLDVVINEVLFNPTSTGVDFVEVVNISKKYLNLKNWRLSNYEGGKVVGSKIMTFRDFLLKPDSYAAFTESKAILTSEYISANKTKVFEVADLPPLSDDEGSVAIVDSTGDVIDKFIYTKELHSPFIRDPQGVSLERISLEVSSDIASNWKSASSISGYATPGYLNSNSRVTSFQSDGSVTVEPEIFSPMASHDNFIMVNYKFSLGGFVGSIKVIDPAGRVIKEIANNELLGTEGFFRWDGDTDRGTKASIGYYMIWFQTFDVTGGINVFKRRVAVAGQF